MVFLIGDAIADAINNTEWIFPCMECFHIAAFAVAIGTIGLVDLRLMGVALKGQTPSSLLKDTWLWSLTGLLIIIMTGMVLFLSDPVHYEVNKSFQFKVTALALAIVYNYTIRQKFAKSDATGGGACAVGAVSLILWLSVLAGGLFIAFV